MAETYATKPFDQWVLRDAQQAIGDAVNAAVGSKEVYEANRKLAEQGDHYRDGEILPELGDPSRAVERTRRLRREQAPTDTANEILDNDVNGLCGTEAAITFVPRVPLPPLPPDASEAAKRERAAAVEAQEAEQARMYEALAADWDRIGFWDLGRAALRYAGWAQRGLLRAWLPVAALTPPPPGAPPGTEPSLPTNLPFDDALALVAVSAVEPMHALRYVQPDTQQVCALFSYRVDDRDAVELWYVTDGGTVRRVLTAETEAGGGVAGEPLALGGRLPLGEVALPRPTLTPALRAQQDALDFDGIAGRVAIKAAGFRQRATLNAQPIWDYVRTRPTNGPAIKHVDGEGVAWYKVERDIALGANQALQLTGEVIEDTTTAPDGTVTTRRSLATPQIHTEEPVRPDLFIEMPTFRRATMLRDAKQGHLANDGRGQLTGVAYVQARAAFKQKLENARGPFERGIRDILEYRIALADVMTAATDPLKGFLDRYRVQVTARVDAGPLTPEERAQFVAEWTAGAYSLETLQARLGIEDTGAERKALERDPMVRLAYLERVAKTFAEIAAVVNADAAARALTEIGVDEPLVRALLPLDTDGLAVETAPAGRPALEVA